MTERPYELAWTPDGVVARVRLQHCPVGNHWSLVVPVRDVSMTEEERQFALANHDIKIP